MNELLARQRKNGDLPTLPVRRRSELTPVA
jgi:hypothetical protein